MTAEEYAKKAVRDLANAKPGDAIQVLTEAFGIAIEEAYRRGRVTEEFSMRGK